MQDAADFSNLKVLVSGAGGFLGSHLCRRLIEQRAEVHAVSRSAPTGQSALHWIRGDFSDIGAVREVLGSVRPEVIFHLAGHGVGGPDLGLVLPTLHNDLVSAVNVLTVATENKCRRMVMAASLEEPLPGDAEATPPSPYAAAKWAIGGYARMFHKLYGAPIVLVRPYMAYGPGQKAHKLIPYVTLSLLRGEEPKLASGLREVDWIYVDDVIDGLLAAARRPHIEGTTIDLGSGTLVTIRDMVMQLVEVIGNGVQPRFGALPDRPVEQVRVADTASAFTSLGWRPVTPLKRGLTLTVDWFRRTLAG